MHKFAGGTSVHDRYPLSRVFRDFRDTHLAMQHVMVSRPTYKFVRRVLVGLESDLVSLSSSFRCDRHFAIAEGIDLVSPRCNHAFTPRICHGNPRSGQHEIGRATGSRSHG